MMSLNMRSKLAIKMKRKTGQAKQNIKKVQGPRLLARITQQGFKPSRHLAGVLTCIDDTNCTN